MQDNNQQPNIPNPRMDIEGGGIKNKQEAIPNKNSIFNLQDFLKTYTSVPTAAPKKFADSVVIYTDSLSSPTVRRLYIYSRELNDWLYVALST